MGINAEVQELTHIINLIFNKKKFDSFKEYCFKNDIYLIDELDDDFVNNYSKIDGIGSKRVDNVKVKLAEAALLKNSVDLIFSTRKYRLFREHCKKNNIKEIENLNLVFIKNFKRKKGIGKGKIEDLYLKLFQVMLIKLKIKEANEFLQYLKVILDQTDYEQFEKLYNNYNARKAKKIIKTELNMKQDIIEEIVDGYLTKFNCSESNLFILEDKIKKIVKELKLSFLLDIHNIENNISEATKLKEVMAGDIDEINKLEIELEKLILLFNKLNKLENPIQLFKNLELDARNKEVFRLRYGEGKTLEEIAEVFNLTRERIRQILKFKIEDYFSSPEIQNKVIIYFQIISKNKNSIKAETIKQILGANSSIYLSFFQNNISKFNYFEPFDIYYFSDKNISNDINNIVTKLPEYFDVYDYLDNILSYMENIKSDPNLDDVKIMLDYFGYNLDQSKEYAVKKNITKRKALEIFFYNYISQPLRINNDNFVYLVDQAKKQLIFDLDFTSVRAMTSVLRNSDKIILVDHLTFFHLEKLDIDITVIFKIDSFLKSKENRNIINIDEIFSKFEEELIAAGINNKILLYSLLKIYLKEYNYGSTNSMNIYLNEEYKNFERKELLLNVLKQNNGIIDKEKVLKILKHWQIEKLNDVVNRSDKILNWGNEIISVENLQIILKDQLKNVVEQKLKSGYLSIPQLLNQLKKDDKLKRVLEINNIDENIKLSSYLKYIFKELTGYHNLLFKKDLETNSIEDIINEIFPAKISRNELYNFFEELNFKNPHSTVNHLIDKEFLVEISKSELINYNNFEINNSIMNKVVNYITFKIANRPYLVLDKLDDYCDFLPKIEYNWTPQLIKYCLKNSQYQEIDKNYKDYRFDNIIITNKKTEINDLVDLIQFILLEEFNGVTTRKKLLKNLIEKNILSKNKSKYSNHLPKEIIDSAEFMIDKNKISLFGY